MSDLTTPQNPQNPYHPTPDREEPAELEYHQLYRAGRRPVWAWSLGGVLTLGAMFLVFNAVVVIIGFTVYYLLTGTPVDEIGDRVTALADTDDVTPAGLLFVNLVLILAIPWAWLCTRVFHDLKPRWLASVAPRIRWKWLAASFVVAVVALVLAVVLGALLPSSADADTMSGELNPWTSTVRDFVLVVALFTPLQAVAEEYVFRGYLTQAFGSLSVDLWVSRALAVGVPALLFALAHGAQDFPIFVDRLAFGISAGVLVVATGGLEAGIAYHVVNNILAFGLTLAYGDMESALSPSGGSWWDVLLTLVKSVVFVGLSVWTARRMGVATRVARTELVAPRARV